MQPTTIQLASFGAPCGMTYFVNVLLNLGFHVYNTPFGPWYNRATKCLIEHSRQLERSPGIPYFLESPLRLPYRDLDIAWAHLWATPICASAPTIIGIRDPRQALYSQWRRVNKVGHFPGTYRQFLNAPYYHLGFSPIDEYILWHALWLLRSGDRDFVLRFELSKSAPVDEFGRLLRWMNQIASDESILNAAARSSVEHARAADPAGTIIVKGALRDFEDASSSDIEALFVQTALPMFETLNVPSDMRDLSSAIDSLVARFGPPVVPRLIDMARSGLFFDLRNEFKRSSRLGPVEIQLRVAVQTLERLYFSPIYPYFNHADSTLLQAAAAVIGTLARSATPHLNTGTAERITAMSPLTRILSAARRAFQL